MNYISNLAASVSSQEKNKHYLKWTHMVHKMHDK